MYTKNQTLEDDFGIWWDMPKYKNRDFQAPKYVDNKIVEIGLATLGGLSLRKMPIM